MKVMQAQDLLGPSAEVQSLLSQFEVRCALCDPKDYDNSYLLHMLPIHVNQVHVLGIQKKVPTAQPAVRLRPNEPIVKS